MSAIGCVRGVLVAAHVGEDDVFQAEVLERASSGRLMRRSAGPRRSSDVGFPHIAGRCGRVRAVECCAAARSTVGAWRARRRGRRTAPGSRGRAAPGGHRCVRDLPRGGWTGSRSDRRRRPLRRAPPESRGGPTDRARPPARRAVSSRGRLPSDIARATWARWPPDSVPTFWSKGIPSERIRSRVFSSSQDLLR